MAIRGCDGVYAFLVCILDHVQEFRIDVRLTLEIKNQPGQFPMHTINELAKEIYFHISSIPCEGPESARTLGTTKITGSGGFY